MNKKWLAPILPYLAVWAGLFLFKSAWLALAGFHLSILFALLVLHSKISIKKLLKGKHPERVWVSVVFCGLSGIGLYFFWNLFGVTGSLPEQLQAIGLNSSSWLPFISYFSIINPFVEEYFWRGFLGSDIKTLHIGDFIYAGYHIFILWGKVPLLTVALALVFLITAGWFWRQICRDNEGLIASVLGHMAADFTILTCIMLKVS